MLQEKNAREVKVQITSSLRPKGERGQSPTRQGTVHTCDLCVCDACVMRVCGVPVGGGGLGAGGGLRCALRAGYVA